MRLLILFCIAALLAGCRLEARDLEAGARAAFEAWAQASKTPYRDVALSMHENDGYHGTVEVTARLRLSKNSDWLEQSTTVECRRIGTAWQCNDHLVFAPVAGEPVEQLSNAESVAASDIPAPVSPVLRPPTPAPPAALPPLPTPTPLSCLYLVEPHFRQYVLQQDEKMQATFGCPYGPPRNGIAQTLPFEHGYMVGFDTTQAILIIYTEPQHWESVLVPMDNDRWSNTDAKPKEGLYLPSGRFGLLWAQDDRRQKLGYATAPVPGQFSAAYQSFPWGVEITNLRSGQIVILPTTYQR